MTTDNRYNSHVMYIDGNTVRKEMVALPVHKPFVEHKKKINRRLSAAEKPANLGVLSVLGIVVAAIITLLLCIDYVQLQTDTRVRLENINKLEEELASLVSANKLLESEVTSYIDLDYVYNVATEELGMRYPTNAQIIYYTSTESEYVRQFGEISEVGSNNTK